MKQDELDKLRALLAMYDQPDDETSVIVAHSIVRLAPELIAQAERANALEAALRPFVDSATHTMVFLASREKMHSAGQALYHEDVERARTALEQTGADHG